MPLPAIGEPSASTPLLLQVNETDAPRFLSDYWFKFLSNLWANLQEITPANVTVSISLSTDLAPSAVAVEGGSEEFEVDGLMEGDFVSIAFQGDQTNGIGIGNAWVPEDGTLAVAWLNTTGASATPGAGTYQIIRQYVAS